MTNTVLNPTYRHAHHEDVVVVVVHWDVRLPVIDLVDTQGALD